MKKLSSLIMSVEEYDKGKWKFPYVYKLGSAKQRLYYFGGGHFFDAKHPQYKELEKLWDEFCTKIDASKALAVNEGGLRGKMKNRELAINSNGEAGLLTWLAQKQNI